MKFSNSHLFRAALLCFGISNIAGAESVGEAAPKPNIVMVMADDMGWGDSGTYGNELIQTPNMDKLAAEGVKFTQCYSACGVCSPSRSAILTGRTPYRNGVWRHLSGKHEAHLRDSEVTFPELLKEIGYETCHVGKWHLLSEQQFNKPEYPMPDGQGYDYYMTTQNNAIPSHKNPKNFIRNGEEVGKLEGYSAPLVADEAIHWLKDIHDKSKPFAMTVWFHEPHSPIATDIEFSKLYKGHKNAKYMGNISQMDYALGKVLEALDEIGAAENTLVFFTSDNGPVPAYGGTSGGLRGNKRNEFEGGIRVPGLARWPGKIEPGTISNVPVIGTDVFSTVLDITGAKKPTDRKIDGVSMVPAFSGKPLERETPLFWRTHVSPGEDRVAMRVGDWKIIGNDTLTKFMLFNIEKDSQEKSDLASEMPEKLDEMKKLMLATWEDIEKDGPSEWWKADKQRPSKGATLSY
ncbi:sulfatase [Luteolibacter sp. AS25]|uniref:sulfatase family protein n=1 Tax=Luteolibacter sp. AS25 TaxID=3135776 RepID=UPI00398AB3E8